MAVGARPASHLTSNIGVKVGSFKSSTSCPEDAVTNPAPLGYISRRDKQHRLKSEEALNQRLASFPFFKRIEDIGALA